MQLRRVHAPFWNATPHCSTEDFVYNGMYIPKGTSLVLNCYTLHHNEARYPDPWVYILCSSTVSHDADPVYREAFNPDRYLGDFLSCAESAHQANAMERDHWTFGAG